MYTAWKLARTEACGGRGGAGRGELEHVRNQIRDGRVGDAGAARRLGRLAQLLQGREAPAAVHAAEHLELEVLAARRAQVHLLFLRRVHELLEQHRDDELHEEEGRDEGEDEEEDVAAGGVGARGGAGARVAQRGAVHEALGLEVRRLLVGDARPQHPLEHHPPLRRARRRERPARVHRVLPAGHRLAHPPPNRRLCHVHVVHSCGRRRRARAVELHEVAPQPLAQRPALGREEEGVHQLGPAVGGGDTEERDERVAKVAQIDFGVLKEVRADHTPHRLQPRRRLLPRHAQPAEERHA
mmetsp:Transcript_14736/g.40187  ORF Transcript_14736/g.40187 Transcript_14736/m.40187 type:complete len:298 (+) Transcript_14736:129-1022(+)